MFQAASNKINVENSNSNDDKSNMSTSLFKYRSFRSKEKVTIKIIFLFECGTIIFLSK